MREYVFSKGLNFDSTPKFIGEGQYADAWNIMLKTSKEGQSGLLRRYPGFFAVPSDSTGTVIGNTEDKTNSRVYFFITGDTDSIWKYNQLTESTEKIFEGDINLSVNHPILGSGIIGDYLYWTDNFNPPRYINTTREYTDIVDSDITLIREAPYYPLEVDPVREISTYSPLTGKAYQFAHRYVYEDNQTSVLSPYTESFYCDEQGTGLVDRFEVFKNIIQDIPKYVRSVELLVRRSDNDFWQIFDTVTPDFFESNVSTFKGDMLGRAISSIEATKPFENIPIRSKALSIARDRIFLGNNIEGYDRVSIPTLSASFETVDLEPYPLLLEVWRHEIEETRYLKDEDGNIVDIEVTVRRFYYVKNGNDFYYWKRGAVTVDGVERSRPPSEYTGDETEATVDSSDPKKQGDFEYLDYFETERNNTEIFSKIVKQTPEHIIDTDLSIDPAIGIRKFKNKSQYRIGIVFYDQFLRNSGVYTNQNCVLTIDDDFRNQDIRLIRWSIDNSDIQNIPDWAYSYQIVRTDNLSRTTFYQGRTSDILWVYTESGDTKYSRTYRSDADYIEIDISGSIKGGLRYNFTPGDLIDIETSTGIVTLQINEVLGAKIRVNVINNPDFATTDEPFPVRLFYEIYRQRSETEDLVWYEVGESFQVFEPVSSGRNFSFTSGILKGDVVVAEVDTYDYEDSRTPATGDITGELSDTPVQITIEAGNLDNNNQVGWVKNLGRLNAVLDSDQAVKLDYIRFSNRYIQGTRVNGTSNFDFGDEKNVGIENGEINNLELVSKFQREGTVMLCICEQEALSLYLGETQMIDNEGNQVVGSTQQVIGTIRQLAGGYGTKHPLSVVTDEGRAWWWDELGRRVVRYTNNGINPISEMNAKSYFYNKTGNPVCGFDPFHELFFIGFEGDDYMISFDEQSGEWRSKYRFFPESIGKINEFMVPFKDGKPYRSNNTTLSNYFGTEEEGSIDFYCVYPNPQLMENIALYLTENAISWNEGKQVLSNSFEIVITNEKGQETNLIPSDFDVLESVAYAHVLRDKNSPGGLLNGEEMRNDVNKVSLKITGDVGFESIIINVQKSSGHI